MFRDEAGALIHPDRLSREFSRVVVAFGFTPIRLHDLRHTYATLALKAGVHPKVVSERLGRATVDIKLDLYSHVTPAIARDAAHAVGADGRWRVAIARLVLDPSWPSVRRPGCGDP